MPGRTKQQLTYTAYHEAGHAVIGRVLGLDCGSVSIVPDYTTMESGHSITFDPHVTFEAWEARGRLRFGYRKTSPMRSIMRARIMMLMAGREAVELCCDPQDSFGDEDDVRELSFIAHYECGDFERLDRLRKATRQLCVRHREKIERVASALPKRHTLTADQVNALMFRS
jgi:ATP-dependent Zn protease